MNNEYSTEDFYLAAYLIYQKHKIVDTRLSGNNTLFTFNSDESMIKEIGKFYSMQTSIDALNYGSAIRSVKSMIHALKRVNTSSNSWTINNANNKRKGREAV